MYIHKYYDRSFQTTVLKNRADYNVFRIIVLCRPPRQTIQLRREPVIGRNFIMLQKQYRDISLIVPLFQKLAQRSKENIQFGFFAL